MATEEGGFWLFDSANLHRDGEYRKVAIREADISAVLDVSDEVGGVGCKVYLRGGKQILLAETAEYVMDTIGEAVIATGFPGVPGKDD